jgi:hypothetical protein
MGADDKNIAVEMARAEVRRLEAVGPVIDSGGTLPDHPGGARGMVYFAIGGRHDLSISAARRNAERWKRVILKYPSGTFYLFLLGYDDDPREIWEITDAARYVRRWARFAGIREPDDIKVRIIDSLGMGDYVIGFLASCGAFGDDVKQQVLRTVKPTRKN